MRPAIKFALSTGCAGLLAFGAAILAPNLGRFSRQGDLLLMLGGAVFALLLVLTPYLASKRHWIPDKITLARSLCAAVPLFFVPPALLLPLVGWGDPDEHLVRGLLHRVHRVLPKAWVAGIGTALVFSIAALLVATFVWLSVSILTKAWRGQFLLLIAGSSVILGNVLMLGLYFLVLFDKNWFTGVVFGLLVFGSGAAYALVIMLNHVTTRWSRALASVGCALLLFTLGASAALMKSSPEKRLPEAPPLRTLDLSSADSVVDESKGWTRFSLLSDQAWSWSRSDAIPPVVSEGTGDTRFPRRPLHFKAESDRGDGADLWFDDGGQRRLLSRYNCGEISLYQINEDRVIATSCTQFRVYDLRGNQVGSDDFVRPEVRFAALSQDHSRFAAIVFLVGFGDPPHLEEEAIVVYDAANARPVLAVKLDPLPKPESWAALSPDGSLLAVGAAPTLRLFRLPPTEDGRPQPGIAR